MCPVVAYNFNDFNVQFATFMIVIAIVVGLFLLVHGRSILKMLNGDPINDKHDVKLDTEP